MSSHDPTWSREEWEDERLLAALLWPRAETSVERAHALARRLGGVSRLPDAGSAELHAALKGLARTPKIEAMRLQAGLELGRRCMLKPLERGEMIRGVDDVLPHLRRFLGTRRKELFVVLLLDARHRLMRCERVSEGCLTWSVVHPREVFAPAVRESAGAIIVAHNHPSGDPTPSLEDREVTRRLTRVGDLLGIPVLDHLVIAGERCVSLRAEGWIDEVADASRRSGGI